MQTRFIKKNEISFAKASFVAILIAFLCFSISFVTKIFLNQEYQKEYTALILMTIALVYSTINLYEYEKKGNAKEKHNASLKNANINLATAQAKIHWLANVIDALVSYSVEDQRVYNKLIALSKYLRTNESMRSTNVKCIPLSKEIENIKNYVELESMMVPEFNIEYFIYDEDIVVPLYTIQTLVDNSIKHGLKTKKENNRLITITTNKIKDYHVIEVKDNGVGFDIKTQYDETHTGLKNIAFRLEETLNAELKIESAIGVGTKVTIKIPTKALQNKQKKEV